MKINPITPNPALISIIKDPSQLITLDANFLIPPSRSGYNKKGIEFKQFKEIWIDPIFIAFPHLAIHEAVYDELVGTAPQSFINNKRECIPPGIQIHSDSTMTEVEKFLRDSIESKIAYHTNYEPLRNNKDDRGEVKTLSYIAVKGLLYFATNDNNAIQLIEKSELWSTGLDNVQAIKMNELLYYLCKIQLGNTSAMKMLYKYLYYLTEREKNTNPNWGDYFSMMEKLYVTYFK